MSSVALRDLIFFPDSAYVLVLSEQLCRCQWDTFCFELHQRKSQLIQWTQRYPLCSESCDTKSLVPRCCDSLKPLHEETKSGSALSWNTLQSMFVIAQKTAFALAVNKKPRSVTAKISSLPFIQWASQSSCTDTLLLTYQSRSEHLINHSLRTNMCNLN